MDHGKQTLAARVWQETRGSHHTECGHLLGQGLSYVGDGTGLLTIDST